MSNDYISLQPHAEITIPTKFIIVDNNTRVIETIDFGAMYDELNTRLIAAETAIAKLTGGV